MESSELSSTILVIFGATGDLTKRKLLPALVRLSAMNMLPQDFRILAFGRREFSDIDYRTTVLPFITEGDHDHYSESFSNRIRYFQGNFSDLSSFQDLAVVIDQYEKEMSGTVTKMYYMATSPDVLTEVVEHLGVARLTEGDGTDNKWTRIIVEKPFGHDYESAVALNAHLLKYFKESQIYRIDHYLGKETVQNILSVRFANIFSRPIWNRDYIESIQIDALETLGVENRGGYYDQAGALRDMVQSHLLQIVALTTMHEPYQYDAQKIRDEKQAILEALTFDPTDDSHSLVLGQYAGYLTEDKISPDSKTETYVALKVTIAHAEWAGVPIYIRSGKKLSRRSADIHVKFKKTDSQVFSNLFCELRSNILSIHLQPNEGIRMKLFIKEPGFQMRLRDVNLEFSYSNEYAQLPDAYERLLLDALMGDQSLFTRADEIEASWKFISGIMHHIQASNSKPAVYQPGEDGPAESEKITTWI